MRRLAEGDRSAFDPVFNVLWPSALSVAVRMLGPGQDAEDAAQEALAKLFARADHYDPARPALPWALTFVSWECRTIQKRRARRREEPLPVAPEQIALYASGPVIGGLNPPAGATAPLYASPEHDLESRQRSEAFAALLEALRPEDRATLAAAMAGDRDAAERAGVTPATFRKRLERALSRARALWRDAYGA